MPSIRHNTEDDVLIDAARQCLLAVGWRRTTLTDVARRAGVSRMTLYRRWPDMGTLLADLMTREWAGMIEELVAGSTGTALDRLADGVAGTVVALRENALFRRVVELDPELLLPYLLDRRGRTQDTVLGLLEETVAEGQRAGLVRAGDPVLLSRSVLLTTHGFVLSAHTMVDPGVDEGAGAGGPGVPDLDAELAALVRRYLAA